MGCEMGYFVAATRLKVGLSWTYVDARARQEIG
jgi:hypothetical protein